RSLCVIPVLLSAVSGHPCTVAVSGHPLYCPQSWSSPCTMSAVSGQSLYCVRSLWSIPVCPQSVHPLYCCPLCLLVHLLYCLSRVLVHPCTVPQSFGLFPFTVFPGV
ncbi:unnamed protein product, partial [Staurois parvus]